MANPLKVLTALSASSGVAVSGSDGLKVQQGGLTVSAGPSTFAGTTISDLGIVTTADINGGTIDGATIATSNITVGSGKTLDVSGGTLTLAAGQVGADKVAAGTFAAGTYSFAGSTISAATAVTASALNISSEADVGSLTVGGGYGSTGVSVSAAGNIQANGTLTVDSTSTLTGDVTFGGNIVADANENKSIFTAVTSNTITVGAAGATVSIPGTASVGGNLTVTGDFTVFGTTTTVASQNVTIKDKNVILGVPDGGAAATDAGADGGGITLSGSTDKTFQWSNATDSWTSSENLDLASGKTFKIATVDVIKQANILNNNATNASILTSGSANAFFAVGSIMGGDSAVISGSSILAAAPQINIGPSSIGGTDPEVYVENQSVRVSAALTLVTGSGQTFTNLNGDISSGYINVVDALHTLDGLVGGSGPTVSPTEYYSVRASGYRALQNDGEDSIFILSGSSVNQPGSNIKNLGAITGLTDSSGDTLFDLLAEASFDVAVMSAGTKIWTNDLVSVAVTASNSGSSTFYPKITVSSPALLSNSRVRLIVVNEKSGSIT